MTDYMRPCRICGGAVEYVHDCLPGCDCEDQDIDMLSPLHERCHSGGLDYFQLEGRGA